MTHAKRIICKDKEKSLLALKVILYFKAYLKLGTLLN